MPSVENRDARIDYECHGSGLGHSTCFEDPATFNALLDEFLSAHHPASDR